MRARWTGINGAFLEVQRQSADSAALFSTLTKTSRFIMQSAMLGVGAYLAVAQQITPGVMIAASIIMSRALAPVEQAVGQWRQFVAARLSLGRLKDVLARMPEYGECTDLPAPTVSLEVSALCVAPPGETGLTLNGVSFSLKAGDGLGIIGPSASGKSTLARALVGVWPALRGEIRLDGAKLDQWESDVLGNHIGYLPQDVELFDGSVAENISRFAPNVEAEGFIEAAQHAGVHEMILHLADGYDTQIGEGGAALSAGQRQRIGLARALYGAPFLIVLDEPNSNLDAEGDAALERAVAALRKRGAIVIVIAHRPSAIESLNTILVLGEGRQQAFGPKEEVLSRTTQRAAQANTSGQTASSAGFKVV